MSVTVASDIREQAAQRFAQLGWPFGVPHALGFPDAIVSKNGHDAFRIMIIITNVGFVANFRWRRARVSLFVIYAAKA